MNTSQCQFIMTRLTALSIAVQANIRTLNTFMEDPTDSARLRDYQRTSNDLDHLVDTHRTMADDYFSSERDEADYAAYLDARDREINSTTRQDDRDPWTDEPFDTSAM